MFKAKLTNLLGRMNVARHARSAKMVQRMMFAASQNPKRMAWLTSNG